MYIDKDAIIICTNVIYYFPHLRRQQEKDVGDMVFEGQGQSAAVSRPQFTPTWRVVCNEGPPWVGHSFPYKVVPNKHLQSEHHARHEATGNAAHFLQIAVEHDIRNQDPPAERNAFRF